MNMKELLLGTVVIAGLSSSASATTRNLSATWRGVSGGDLCNLTINTEAAAKYLNDELEKRTITASVLADYIMAAAEAVDIERSIRTTSTARKCWAWMQCNRFLIPTLSLREARTAFFLQLEIGGCRLGVFGNGRSIHQVPFLHAHPNGR